MNSGKTDFEGDKKIYQGYAQQMSTRAGFQHHDFLKSLSTRELWKPKLLGVFWQLMDVDRNHLALERTLVDLLEVSVSIAH